MSNYEKGMIVQGTVTCIEPYGAFMSFDDYFTGLIHISEISNGFVHNINDFINIGDHIFVEILDVDNEEFHLKLSIKNINYRIDGDFKKNKIIETKSGFNTLSLNLPVWIEKKIKSIKNTRNTIDK